MTHKISGRRKGMTLIEIMIAILILSIGLLGVLAAVPFGAMQMNKMVEKDFVTNTAKNAHQILATNGWLTPANWMTSKEENDGIGVSYPQNGSKNDDPNSAYEFTFPVILDPCGYVEFPFTLQDSITARDISLDSSEINEAQKTDMVSLPQGERIDIVFPDCSYLTVPSTADANPYDRLFRSTDDIVYHREDNSTNRPTVLMEDDDSVAFTGEYSWLAMITPLGTGTDNDYNALTFPDPNDISTLSKIVDVRTDVVVFRGRTIERNDYIRAKVLLTGGGYAGGTIELYPTVCRGDDNGTDTNIDDFEENLQSSTHILLIGPSDGDAPEEETDNKQYFSSWYKIANIGSQVTDNGNDGIQVTLIGADCPNEWYYNKQNNDNSGLNADYVQAVVFKNVRGVSTETTRLEEK